jgi:hypothetical protein
VGAGNDAPCPPLTSHGASIMLQYCAGPVGAGGTPPPPVVADDAPACIMIRTEAEMCSTDRGIAVTALILTMKYIILCVCVCVCVSAEPARALRPPEAGVRLGARAGG